MSSKAYFENVAQDWDTMRQDFFPNAVRESALELMDMKRGMSVADIGAGTGFITESLMNYPIEITMVDQSENMLATSKEKFSRANNIHYLCSDAENIGVAESSFDYALANMFLHHVERPSFTIKELYRTIRPGGMLIITDLDTHNFEFLVEEQNDRWMGFDREDISRWFSEAGFKNVKIDCVNANCCADSCNTNNAAAEISIFRASGEK